MPTDPDLLTVAIHTVPEGAAIFAAGKYIGNSPVDGLYVPNEYSKAKGLVTFEITAAWPSGAIWDGIVVTPMPPGHPLKNASVSLIQPSKVDGPYQDSLHVRMMGPLFALEDQRLRAEQRQRSEQEMAQMRARQEANQRAQQEAQQRAQQEAQQQQQQQQQAGSGVSGTDIALMLLGGFLTGVVQGMNRPVAPMINCRSDTYGNTTRTSCY
jgi:hypothetical protein